MVRRPLMPAPTNARLLLGETTMMVAARGP
jgi:hypothetical protein